MSATQQITVTPAIDLKSLDNELPPLTIYCLPVSGGGFVGQLGLLSEVYEAKWIACDRRFNGSKDYKPNLIFAASGGNVASYIALAGDWSPAGIMRIALKIEVPLFIRSWLPEQMSFIPTWVVGAMKGAIYRQGYGAGHLFRSIYTSDTVQRTEIWTGTYDAVNKRAQFFCNLDRSKSLVNPDHFNDSAALYGCMPLKYLNGDLEKIAASCMASASIPMLVAKQHIDGLKYADGGIMYASPTTVMTSEIHRLIMGDNPYKKRMEQEFKASLAGQDDDHLHFRVENGPEGTPSIATITSEPEITQVAALGQRSLRLIYFCSYEMDVPFGELAKGSGGLAEPISQLLYSNVLQDRHSAVSVLYRICGDDSINIQTAHYAKLDKELLAAILKELNKQRHYVVVLYPHGTPSIALTSFKAKDIEAAITTTRQAYGGYIWYYSYPTKGDEPRKAILPQPSEELGGLMSE